jgi:hypothetical protein
MMNNIQDLDFFEIFDSPANQICGGVYTQVNVSASTSYNLALAGAGTVALGNNTSTSAQTTTNVQNAPYFSNSYARATGLRG